MELPRNHVLWRNILHDTNVRNNSFYTYPWKYMFYYARGKYLHSKHRLNSFQQYQMNTHWRNAKASYPSNLGRYLQY